jgi:hypothetical protein
MAGASDARCVHSSNPRCRRAETVEPRNLGRRRGASRWRLALVLGGLVAATGCSKAWQAARRGQEALDRGDPVTALAEYDAACRDSSDEAWCERAARLYRDVKADLVKQATPLCGVKGQERACLAVVNQARRVKDDPELAALADAAGQTWLATCRGVPQATPAEAIARVRCFEALSADVATAGYRQQVAAARLEAARVAAEKAKDAVAQRRVASALGLAALSKCLSRDVTPAGSEASLRAAIVERDAVAVATAADGLLSRELVCGDVEQVSEGRLRCAASNTAAGLRASLFRGELTHTFSDAPRSVEYVVRREEYDNPEWLRLDQLRRAHADAVREARDAERRAEDDCSRARGALSAAGSCQACAERTAEQARCGYASQLEDHRRQTQSALDDVERALWQTERRLVNEVRDAYHWVLRTHEWRQPYRVIIQAAGGPPSSDFVVTLRRTDDEQQGFPPADVPELVPVAPDGASLDADALAQTREALRRWVKDAQRALSAQREAACAGLTEAGQGLECQASSGFLAGRDPAVEVMAALGREANALGPWPSAACAP